MISYQFTNLIGTVFTGGNVLFAQQQSLTDATAEETLLLSPVGNKLTYFDLTNNVAQTLPFQNRSNISRVELSPDGRTLVTIDVDGFALIINFIKKVVVAHFNFKGPVSAFSFSPDSKFMFVAVGKKVKIFETPSVTHKVYSPMVLYKKYANLHSEDITGVTWTRDSRFFVTWSSDLTMKMMSLHKIEGYLPFTFGGHKKPIVNAFFNEASDRLFSVSQNGAILIWKWTDDRSEGVQKNLEFAEFKMGKRLKTGHAEKPGAYKPGEEDKELYSEMEKKINIGRFLLEKKTKISLSQPGVKVVSCEISPSSTNRVLVIGQNNGVFGLLNAESLESIHSFQISESKIDSISINHSGEWIALASRELGQLFVWEWKSETYILKQQGHFFDLNTLAFSGDGSYIATGGDDGKIKLWTTKNHLSFATFADHTSQVTDLKFIPKKNNTLISASMDGTVRAYDLVKYRNFRILQANKATQFNSVAVDANSGDIIVAGSLDPFSIFVWSLRTGQLIDILNGHTGPISSLCFSPNGAVLVSGSWDQTVRVWDIFEKKGSVEALNHASEVLSVDFHPNGKDIISTTLGGQLYLWQTDEGNLLGMIDCKQDLAGGRLQDERVTAKKSTRNKHFNSVAISPNGEFILGGGNSKNICLYDMRYKLLMKRFAVTQNRSFDGVLHMLNSKGVKDGVAEHELDVDSDLEEDAWQIRNKADANLPGAKHKNNAQIIKRKTKLAIRVKSVKFSPDGTQFACATTEGLLIYSLKNDLNLFNPVEIDENVTIDSIIQNVKQEQYLSAIILSLRINEREITEKVFKCIPFDSIPLLAAHFPSNYLQKFLVYLSGEIEKGRDVEWNLHWIKNILKFQEPTIRRFKDLGHGGRALLLKIYSSISFFDQSIKKIANENIHMIKFMLKAAQQRKLAAQAEETTME